MINVWYILQLRLQAIKRCEETIMNAIRQGDPNVIQAGCVTQWNLILALLQPNLRRHVRKPLTLLADALEDIQRYMYGATWFWNINSLLGETCAPSFLIWKKMFLLILVVNLVRYTVNMSHMNELLLECSFHLIRSGINCPVTIYEWIHSYEWPWNYYIASIKKANIIFHRAKIH